MKKILSTLVIALASYSVYAQTNTLPTSGYVGIGTTAPLAPLHVFGNLITAGGSANIDGVNLNFLSNSSQMIIGWNRSAGNGEINFISNQGLGSIGGFSFYNHNNSNIETQLLYIRGDGNVGIGTTSPLAKFVVAGDYNNTGAGGIMLDAYPASPDQYSLRINPFVIGSGKVGYQFQTKNITGGTTIPLTFDNAGNVGIGTSSPNSLLTIGSSSTRGTVNVIGSNTDAAAVSLSDSRTSGHQYTFYNGVSAIGNLDVYDQTASAYRFQINASGNVGIGTTSPDQKLTVNGTIHSKEVKVDTSIPVPDYVFEPTYKLPQLTALKTYLDANHHLPEIPSAAEIEKNGLNLGEMNIKLLKKVEELTLYLIEKDKEIKDLKNSQQAQIDALKTEMKLLKQNPNH